jgi:PAS domain S-box-containing protein
MITKELLQELYEYAQQMRLLYVEDDSDIRENTTALFQSFFPSITLAENGKEGLKTYESGEFDLVVSDILMPEMNGVAMVREIKKRNPQQKVIITSACDESDYLLELINLGVSSFILKPLQSDQIISTLYTTVTDIYNSKKVIELTHELERELRHKSNLLEQYKEIVDITAIVSKTDLKGRITYVNKEFCDASGYTEEELIGQHHNIVRHSDMPSRIYKVLWETIKAKHTWRGVIKNRTKDGGYYITDATIKPILDEEGEIIEYMSMRHNVTELFDLNDEITNTQHELLYLLGEVGETRSEETGNHVRRVAEYSRLLASLCDLDDEQIQHLYSASPMHDIGKIGIPDAILLKPGKLTDEEFEQMKSHAKIGHDILKNSNRPILKAAAIIAHEHHERWDGSGYPRGLEGENIHIFGRITALADVYDALSCERVYKDPWPMEKILELIKKERGSHFDPQLVDLMLDNIDAFKAIGERLR